jgi:hypothetical protein
MEKKFVYPLISNDKLPKSNPTYQNMHSILWQLHFNDWNKFISKNNRYIYQLCSKDGKRSANGKKQLFIPEGTKLYHGSIYHFLDFNNMTRDSITFFGLDVIISLWYIYEAYLRGGNTTTNYGSLYEFEVIKPVPVHFIEEFDILPETNDKCLFDKRGCIHGQIAPHGTVQSPYPVDLCIELTLNLKYFKKYIKMTKVYTVDVMILHKNRRKKFESFNPVESIIYEQGGNHPVSLKK